MRFLPPALAPRLPALLRLRRALFGAVLAGCGLGVGVPALASKPAAPSLQIALEPLGFTPIANNLLAAGFTMLTLNFVDSRHLLFTFQAHGLMPRLADAAPDDDDRLVDAVLLELPSGKVLARTRWRTRDHDRYLWALGNGRFLLRTRQHLALLDPLRNLGAGSAFHEETFADMQRRIGLIDVSPGGDLVTVETVPPKKPKLTGAAASAAALARTVPGASQGEVDGPLLESTSARPRYTLHFFRVLEDRQAERADKAANPGENSPVHLTVQSAGRVDAPVLVRVPITGAGYLSAARESAGVYNFDFHTHAGKTLELAPYESSCQPHAFFTGATDFVAFGCHGSDEKLEFSAFNLRGENPWVAMLSGDQLSASVIASPAAGRFGFERALAGVTDPTRDPGTPAGTPVQEVTVYQHHDGRALLKMQPSPTQIAGQNYDLAPDGLSFASIAHGAITVYDLPALTPADRKQMALASELKLEKAAGPIHLNAKHTQLAEDDAGSVEQPAPDAGGQPAAAAPSGAAPSAPAPAVASSPANAAPAAVAAPAVVAPAVAAPAAPATREVRNGDVQPTGEARKPPTLYDPAHPKPQQ